VHYVWLSGIVLGGLITGCGPKTGPAADPAAQKDPQVIDVAHNPDFDGDPVIATASGTSIRESQILKPLKEAYGFNLLMYVVQCEMAKDALRQQGVTLAESDIANERNWTLDQMFENAKEGEDREKLLEQFLNQPKPRDQMMTSTEFDIILETNAAMRKLAEGSLKTAITDEDLRMQFDERYGASVRVRHIMCANPQEVMKVERRLAAGEDFAEVARVESRNPDTKRVGGLLPPFTINDRRLPENFRRVAFALKEGEVSGQVHAEGSYHLIKLEKRISPKAVKFEDVKDSLKEDIQNRLIVEAVKEIRNRLGQQALATLKIDDPALQKEFSARLKARDQLIRDREKIRDEMTKQRDTAATQPTTEPAAVQVIDQPPATKSAANASATKPAATEPSATEPSATKATTNPAAIAPPAPGGATTQPAPTTAPSTQQ